MPTRSICVILGQATRHIALVYTSYWIEIHVISEIYRFRHDIFDILVVVVLAIFVQMKDMALGFRK